MSSVQGFPVQKFGYVGCSEREVIERSEEFLLSSVSLVQFCWNVDSVTLILLEFFFNS